MTHKPHLRLHVAPWETYYIYRVALKADDRISTGWYGGPDHSPHQGARKACRYARLL